MTTSNSILEYYRRKNDRYFVARIFDVGDKTHIKYLWQPMATRALVPGYEQFDLFIYREGRTLNLCEALTGAVIVCQNKLPTRAERRMNKKDFITTLPTILQKQGGAKEINILIVNFLVDHEQLISPRYEAKEV